MLGPPKARRFDPSALMSLENLVLAGDSYCHLNAALGLSFVRDWVRDRYAERGRPSIDPVVFFRLQRTLSFEGLRSERRLIETTSLNLAHRWYLGYHLDELLPNHSSLGMIRERYGLDLFRRFFDHSVPPCTNAGLLLRPR